MSETLLTTKLYIPPLRPGLVTRPRLLKRLNAGLLGKVTLLSAPAGYGKSTLINEWAHQTGLPVAWLSLDVRDNDTTRFLVYVIAALQEIDEWIGEDLLYVIKSPQPSPMEALLTALINQVNDISRKMILVLDDYHLITAQSVHDSLSFLLDHQPANLHLVISTRSDPRLPIARLRGRGQLSELRQTDLRFTIDETSEFLNQVMGLDLSVDEISTLASCTEGWIAGLQMAVISMRGQENISSFIRDFKGSNRYIIDYLVEEVLQRQPVIIQKFLLRTAILDRLSGPLCDAVTGFTEQLDGQTTLEQLERSNLFIVPLDSERRWYRYHHLFSDLLRQRLQRAQPDLIPELHRRASIWYEQIGQVPTAIDHALSAMDLDKAVQLVELTAESVMLRSEIATLRNWLEILPDEVVCTRPLLSLYYAGTLLLSGRPLEFIEARIQDAISVDANGSFSGEVMVLRALIAAYRGELRQSAEFSHRALKLLPERSLYFRSLIAGTMGLPHLLYSGDIPAATQAFEEAFRISQKTGNLMIGVLALCHLGQLSELKGRLHEARAFYEQALELAVDDRGRQRAVAGVALIGLGGLFREWNNLEAATSYLIEGIQLTKAWGNLTMMYAGESLARVREAQGNEEGANEAIQKAKQIAKNFNAMEIAQFHVAFYEAQLWIAQGKIEDAVNWAEKRGLVGTASLEILEREAASDSLRIIPAFEYATLAQLRIVQGQTSEALAILKPLSRRADSAGWIMLLIQILILESLALRDQGDDTQALAALERALSLAQPEGYVRVFLDFGTQIIELLQKAAVRGIEVEYVCELLSAWRQEYKDESQGRKQSPVLSTSHPAQPLVEPLSDRELEVLGLLANGLSNKEIAKILVISIETVKKHLKNIYGKFDVHSRTEAVARGRDIDIL
jgi:LuxR family maltose regulon positive regulatory protein